MSKTYRNSGAYRTSDTYRGGTAGAGTALYTIDLTAKKNLRMKGYGRAPQQTVANITLTK